MRRTDTMNYFDRLRLLAEFCLRDCPYVEMYCPEPGEVFIYIFHSEDLGFIRDALESGRPISDHVTYILKDPPEIETMAQIYDYNERPCTSDTLTQTN